MLFLSVLIIPKQHVAVNRSGQENRKFSGSAFPASMETVISRRCVFRICPEAAVPLLRTAAVSGLIHADDPEAGVVGNRRRLPAFAFLFCAAACPGRLPGTAFHHHDGFTAFRIPGKGEWSGSPLPAVSPHVDRAAGRRGFRICVNRCRSVFFSAVEIRILRHMSGGNHRTTLCDEKKGALCFVAEFPPGTSGRVKAPPGRQPLLFPPVQGRADFFAASAGKSDRHCAGSGSLRQASMRAVIVFSGGFRRG